MRTIVCHGDSLTEGSDLEKNYTWPYLVENRVNVNVINSGIGGDTSGGLLGRFYRDVIRHQPEMVVILGGTNDLWWDLDIKMILANIFAMACQAQYSQNCPDCGSALAFIYGKHPAPKYDGSHRGVGHLLMSEKMVGLLRSLFYFSCCKEIPRK